MPTVPTRVPLSRQHPDVDARIWEDQEDQEAQAADSAAAATTIIQDDVEPLPEDNRNLQPLSTNIMGIHFGEPRSDGNDEDDELEDNDDEQARGDDNKTISGVLLPDDKHEDPHHVLIVGGEDTKSPEDVIMTDVRLSAPRPARISLTLNTEA